MRAIQYVKSVPRYLTARWLGPRWNGLYTSPLGCLRLAEMPAPALPGDRWVRVRPLLAGICGSDLATLTAQGSPYFSPFTSCPFVLGHEVVGQVEEVGAGVADLRAGQRVVLQPPLHCQVRGIEPPCAACARGDLQHCLNLTRGCISAGIQTGFCRDTGGGWSGGFVAHELQLHRVPDELADEAAVLVEPFACCLHAAARAPLADDKTVLVLGCGTIGALSVAAIRALDSRCRLVVVAKHAHQQALARRLGADVVVGTGALYADLPPVLRAESYRPELGRPVWLGGADVTFDCIGSERSIDDALRFTRGRGAVILVGMPAVPRGVDWTAIWHKELVVQGAYTSDAGLFRRALDLAAGVPGGLGALVGAKFPLDRFAQAIDCALHTGRTKVFKTVFQP